MKFIWFLATASAASRAGVSALAAPDLLVAVFHGGPALAYVIAAVTAARLPYPWLSWPSHGREGAE